MAIITKTGIFLLRRYLATKKPPKMPEPPPEYACCGQGCANCVYLQYGQELIDFYSHRNKEKALREVEKQVSDPTIRAFVLTELKMKWKL